MSNSKTVIGFDQSGGLPVMCNHTFAASDRGELLHFTDGRLRATVPPEGWGAYAEAYPDAQSVIAGMKVAAVMGQA